MDSRVGLPANTVLGESYRIVRQIGAGGFGITYAAEDVNLGTTVAIKEYYPEEFGDRNPNMSVRAKSERHKPTFEWGRASFIQEARTLARFQHQSVVRVTRVFEAHSTAYMVMDFEQGQSFEVWLKGLGRLPTQEELDRIAGPLLDALEIMHAQDFLHRDIAPDNIIIRADGTPVLLDFSAARRAVAERSRTLTGVVKAGYSPQEQYATDGRLQGPWSDLYALGATLYRAVTGAAPEESTLRGIDDRMVPASVAAAGIYRPGFLTSIDACLKVSGAERPQSVTQLRPMLLGQGLRTTLETARFAETRKLGGAESTHTASTTRPREGRWLVAAVMLMLGGSAYGGYEYLRWHAEERARKDAEQADATEANKRAAREAQAKAQAEARRQEEERIAREQARRKQEDPGVPFSEYFADMTRPTSPPAVPPSGGVGPAPSRQGNGWLGIKIQSVTENLAESFGTKNGFGALVAIVTPDSPAQKAGLQEADVILRFDGKDIKSMRDLLPTIRSTTIGKTVDIGIWRAGQMLTLQATVGRSQGEESTPSRRRGRN